MAFAFDVTEIEGLAEKFERLTTLFSAFNFPPLPHKHASPIEVKYWKAVMDLFVFDADQLDRIAQECSQEFQLQYSMDVDDMDQETWLGEFIARIDIANTENAESLVPAFSASQTALSQEDPEPGTYDKYRFYFLTSVYKGNDFGRTISYTTTIGGSPPQRFSQPAANDIAQATIPPESPTLSMQRLGTLSPSSCYSFRSSEQPFEKAKI
jgi:hypothetical protein